MQECRARLDSARYACFAHPEHSSQTPALPKSLRRRSWNPFSFSAAIPEVPREVFESLPVLMDQDDGESYIGSFSVSPSHPPRHLCGLSSFLKLQDGEWSDEVGARETLSTLARSLGFELAKRLVYRINQ